MATPVRRRGTSGDGYGSYGPSTPLQRHLLFDEDDGYGMTPDHYYTTPASFSSQPLAYPEQGPLSFSSNGRFASPLPFGVSPRTPIEDEATLAARRKEENEASFWSSASKASPYAADPNTEWQQYDEAVQADSTPNVQSDNKSVPTPPSEINWTVSVNHWLTEP